MTDEELKNLVAELAVSQKETDRQIQETDRQIQETGRQLKETDRQLRRQMRKLGQQIGGLGEKFGTYTEGMAEAGLKALLLDRFQMTSVAQDVRVRRNGHSMQVDLLGYTNDGRDEAFVVEIKSKLRQDELDRFVDNLGRFRDFFPEHRNKKLYGIVAAAYVPEQVAPEVHRQGLYLARLGSTVSLDVPEGFEARSF